jgi:mannose-6-phosphate isomerase
MGQIAKLSPHLTFKPWGGTKLKAIKGISSKEALGETWEISTHRDGVSKLGDMFLSDICKLSYLFKFIDTQDNLSIQVHPGDEYAQIYENDLGKTECWIILEARPGAGIYLGLKNGISKKEFKTAIENNLKVDQYLNFIPVSVGDYFYVPYGTIHALGADILLAELQQSSGVTYRVWDWNRVDDLGNPRPLHVEKAIDVINFDSDFNQKLLLKKHNLFASDLFQKVVDHPMFKADLLTLQSGESKEVRLLNQEGVSCLSGEVLIDEIPYSKFQSGICLKEGVVTIVAKEKARLLMMRG